MSLEQLMDIERPSIAPIKEQLMAQSGEMVSLKRGRRLSCGALYLSLVLILATACPSLAQRPSEYQVKAAFLYNFTNFVEWPASTLPDSAMPLTIGILGDDPFAAAFAPFNNKLNRGRMLHIVRSTRLQELPFCHILFIAKSENKHLPQILEYFKDRHVLTVSETPDFVSSGGMINFVLIDKKVRFEINVDAAERAGLKLSSKLLKLAILVTDNQGSETKP